MHSQRTARVADLKPGDATPWYTVKSDPEPLTGKDADLVRLTVTYTDTGADGAVIGAPDEEVPLV